MNFMPLFLPDISQVSGRYAKITLFNIPDPKISISGEIIFSEFTFILN